MTPQQHTESLSSSLIIMVKSHWDIKSRWSVYHLHIPLSLCGFERPRVDECDWCYSWVVKLLLACLLIYKNKTLYIVLVIHFFYSHLIYVALQKMWKIVLIIKNKQTIKINEIAVSYRCRSVEFDSLLMYLSLFCRRELAVCWGSGTCRTRTPTRPESAT